MSNKTLNALSFCSYLFALFLNPSIKMPSHLVMDGIRRDWKLVVCFNGNVLINWERLLQEILPGRMTKGEP
ncbi:MAG TPA: hypothetical protein DEF42_15145 [Desulfosporosinus sp.]|nr:hypothetical protein [Desulfosporosinus sp.]